MIRSYLRYVKAIDMVLKRLTKIQKAEIVEAYRAGENTNDLAKKYSCTANTINRTVKNLLSDPEYKLLKEKRSKIRNKKERLINFESDVHESNDLGNSNSFVISQPMVNEEFKSTIKDENFSDSGVDKISSLPFEDANDFKKEAPCENKNNENLEVEKLNNEFENGFEEIAPLVSSFGFELENQKLDFEILDYQSLPEIVYMLVDKKVELDTLSISTLPEWNFLPENELNRTAILLFPNQRSAKRSCSKSQRVIKIPNTNVFKISKSYLVSKGITRLILEDSIIALDD